jgi:hypothetical protein
METTKHEDRKTWNCLQAPAAADDDDDDDDDDDKVKNGTVLKLSQ